MPDLRTLIVVMGKGLVLSRSGRWLLRTALNSAPGRYAAFAILAARQPRTMRVGLHKLRAFMDTEAQLRFVEHAGKRVRAHPNRGREDIYWLALANSAAVERAWTELQDPEAMPNAGGGASGAEGRVHARAIAAFELARYRDAVESFRAIRARDPEELKLNNDYLKAAFSAAKLRDKALALEFFAGQYVDTVGAGDADFRALADEIMRGVSYGTIHTLASRLMRWIGRDEPMRCGVFYLSSTEALGHAILDAYHFLALYRDRYDRIFFIGPRLEAYRPASRVCINIVGQHGDYVETGSEPLLNLSWMSLGCFELGPYQLREGGHDPATGLVWHDPAKHGTVSVELVVEHYWSLLREAVHRSLDPDDSFQHNAWQLELPDALVRFGEEACNRLGIDLDRPLVVLHARDQRYHNIGKQSYRDANISNYVPAIEYLLACGYQVVRLGDDQMSKLVLKHAGYCELPFLEGYDHRLDPFLISRARFMIGCQSGPCAYARAFGVPLLTVNAVLHYTLLPSVMEMACFKRYFRLAESGEPAGELDIEEALEAGVSHFDNSYQFRQARIGLADAEPEEILAATEDMTVWLDDPELAETPHQTSFREAVAQYAAGLKRKGESLDLPIADFLGISLPCYRISPSVAAMRAKPAATVEPGPAAQSRRRAAAE